jgi:hypothetical protein
VDEEVSDRHHDAGHAPIATSSWLPISFGAVGEPRKFTLNVEPVDLPRFGPCIEVSFREWDAAREEVHLDRAQALRLRDWLTEWLGAS